MSELRPEPQTIVLGVASARGGPLGLQLRARAFLEAAQLTHAKVERFSPVASFLYCRALEVAFKAYLLARDGTLDQVAAFGHDLERLLVESFAHGLDAAVVLSVDERQVILDVNEHYLGNKLAYFDLFATLGGYSGHPELDALGHIAEKLVDGIEHGCYEAAHGGWKPF